MNDVKKKLLIVEDEESLSSVLKDKFETVNFTVSVARNGIEGYMLAEKMLPDVILLDIIMPKEDGITLLNKIRESEWGKEIPVFMLTNKDDSESISVSMNNKITRYIIKADTSLERIVEEVKDFFARVNSK